MVNFFISFAVKEFAFDIVRKNTAYKVFSLLAGKFFGRVSTITQTIHNLGLV